MATETTPAADQLAHEWVLLMANIGSAQIALAEVVQQVAAGKSAMGTMVSIGEAQGHLELAWVSLRLLNEAGFVKALGGN